MTKQHFVAAAKIVDNIRCGDWDFTTAERAVSHAQSREYDYAAVVADAFQTLFRQYNPRFDSQRFLVACGLQEKPR